jgi:hypothetical protein
MYTQTRSKTVAEATHKLFHSEVGNSVASRTIEQLTDLQRECLDEYLADIRQYTEDIKLALENLYVNLDNDHIYILEVADDYDDSIQYYYCELTPLATLYEDALGNLYYDNGIVENDTHQLILVEKDDDHYIYTQETWYEDADRLAELYTKTYVEVR